MIPRLRDIAGSRFFPPTLALLGVAVVLLVYNVERWRRGVWDLVGPELILAIAVALIAMLFFAMADSRGKLRRLNEQTTRLSEMTERLASTVAALNDMNAELRESEERYRGLAQELEEAREKAEAATRLVAERARLIEERGRHQDELRGRLDAVKADVQAAGAGLAGLQKPAGAPSDEEKARIAAELERMLEPMARFVEAARAVKAEAARGGFRRVERQADSLIDSLEASRRKIAQALPRRQDPPAA